MSSKTDSIKTPGSGNKTWKALKRGSKGNNASPFSSSSSSWQKQLSFKVKGAAAPQKEDRQQLLGSFTSSSASPSPKLHGNSVKSMSRDADKNTNNKKSDSKNEQEGATNQVVERLSNFFHTANTVDKMSHSMHGTGIKKKTRQQGSLNRHSTHGMPVSGKSTVERKTSPQAAGGKPPLNGKPPVPPEESALKSSSSTDEKKKTKASSANDDKTTEQTATDDDDKSQTTPSSVKDDEQPKSAPIKLITQLQAQNRSHQKTNAALNAQIEILKKQITAEQNQHKAAVERMKYEQEETNLKLSVLEKHFCELNTAGDNNASQETKEQQQIAADNTSSSIVQLDAAYVSELKEKAESSTDRITALEKELEEIKQKSIQEETILRDEVEDLSTKLQCREETVHNLEHNLKQLREARFQAGASGGSVSGSVGGSMGRHHHRRHRRIHSTSSAAAMATAPRRSPRFPGGAPGVGAANASIGAVSSIHDDDDASVVSYAESVVSVGDASVMSALGPPQIMTTTPNASGTAANATEEDIAKAVTEAVKAAITKRDEEFKGKVERLRERTRQRLATRENKIAKLERKIMVLEKNAAENPDGGAGSNDGNNGGGVGIVSATATLAAQERPMLLNLRTLSVTSEMMDGSIHRLENMMRLFSEKDSEQQLQQQSISPRSNDDSTLGGGKDKVLTLAQKLSLLQEELRVSIQLLDQRTKNRLETLRDAAEEEERMKAELKQEKMALIALEEGKEGVEGVAEEGGEDATESTLNAQSGQSSGEGAEQEKTPGTATADASISAPTSNDAAAATEEKSKQQEQQEIIQYQQSIADLISEVHREIKEALRETEVNLSKKMGSLKEEIRVNQFDLDAKRDIIESLEIACAENDRNVRALTSELNELKEKDRKREAKDEKEKMEKKGEKQGEEQGKEDKVEKEEEALSPSRKDRWTRKDTKDEERTKKEGDKTARRISGAWGRKRSPKRSD